MATEVDLVVKMVVGAALSWFSISIAAQERTNLPPSIEVLASASTLTDLEKAFWTCDYLATTQGVETGTAIVCSVFTENLKIRKFNGDFDLMLAWWRRNKAAEHQALETASRATSGR